MGNDSSKFRITEAVFRFGADVRSGDDPREAAAARDSRRRGRCRLKPACR